MRLIGILILILSLSVDAQITQLASLDLGKVVVSDNQQVSTLTLLPNNTHTSTNKIYIMQNGHAAELVLEGYPARVQLNISDFVNNQPLDNVYGGASFTLNQLIYSNSISTDSYGTALLRVGAQLSTSGDGRSYLDGLYNTAVEITIDY